MPYYSISQYAIMTGRTRETISRKLTDAPCQSGKKGAKTYESKMALERIFGSDVKNGEPISAAEAQRLLTIKRGEQIDLEMEIARKDRIPIGDIESVNDRVMQNIAGLLKAHNGKQLDETLIGDIFTELREMGASIKNG